MTWGGVPDKVSADPMAKVLSNRKCAGPTAYDSWLQQAGGRLVFAS